MKASVIGFYAFAYPEGKMTERVDNAIKELQQKNVNVNFVGYVKDRDEASPYIHILIEIDYCVMIWQQLVLDI